MSVADKMTQIAQNVPKVYESGKNKERTRIFNELDEALVNVGAEPVESESPNTPVELFVGRAYDEGHKNGYAEGADNNLAIVNQTFANALKGRAKGEAVTLHDVSPVGHNVVCTVKSKNLLDLSTIGGISSNDKPSVNGGDIVFPAKASLYGFICDASLDAGVTYTASIGGITDHGSDWGWRAIYEEGGYVDRVTSRSSVYTFTPIKKVSRIQFYVGLPYTGNKEITVSDVQLEEGLSATEYTPHIDPTEVKVLVGGKNVLSLDKGFYHRNGETQTINYTITDTGMRIEPLRDYDDYWAATGFYLGEVADFAGKTVTISAKYFSSMATSGTSLHGSLCCTDVEPCPSDKELIYTNGGFIGSSYNYIEEVATGTDTYRITGGEGKKYLCVLYYPVYGGPFKVGDVVEISDMQVEYGDTATDYEPYKSIVEYEQGESITSRSPNMSITTDTYGALVDVEYNRDINKAFETLVEAIISLGGNV